MRNPGASLMITVALVASIGCAEDTPRAVHARFERLFGRPATQAGLTERTLAYALQLRKPLFLGGGTIVGDVTLSLTCEQHLGRDVYRFVQTTSVKNRWCREESVIDARGLFPYHHSRITRRPDEPDLVETLLWDHLGLRAYREKCTIDRDGRAVPIRRQQWVLDKDVPASAVDPLTVLLLYRLTCIDTRPPTTWSHVVITVGGDILNCVFQPVSRDRQQVTVQQRMKPIGEANEEDAAVSWTLALDGEATPLRFSGQDAGLRFMAELVER